MEYLKNYNGDLVRLTDERLAHILEHPEMAGMKQAISDTLLCPDIVVRSRSDDQAQLYYRYYTKTMVGGKFLCVVVKAQSDDSFILTAYLTNEVKKGVIVWSVKL